MKILFLANRVPYPPFRGDKLKIHNLAKRLKGKHELHLITFVQNSEEWQYEEILHEFFDNVTLIPLPKWKSILLTIKAFFTGKPFQIEYFHSNRLKNILQPILHSENFDAIHVQHLRMAQHIPEKFRNHAILDLPDAFSLYWKRRYERAKGFFTSLFAKVEHSRLLKYEKAVLSTYKKVLVCSYEDLYFLRNNIPHAQLDLLPNGVDLETFKPSKLVEPIPFRVLFTGNMDYEPNIDAVIYFVNNMWPFILQSVPDAEFIIAGQRPVKRVKSLASSNIKVTGFIKNLADEYAKASVVVAPLRFGAGTQNKVIEAMSMGIPVVCTEVGFKGLGIQSGEGAFMEKEEISFIHRVVELLTNKPLAQNTGEKGKDFIKKTLDWDIIAKQLEQYLYEVKINK